MGTYPYYTEPSHIRGAITTGVPGGRDSSDLYDTGQLRVDCVDKIFLLEPRKYPFSCMLTQVGKDVSGNNWEGIGMPKAVTGSYEFKWLN